MTKTSRATFESGLNVIRRCESEYPIADIVQNFWPNVLVYLGKNNSLICYLFVSSFVVILHFFLCLILNLFNR